nr:ribonuclease H [Tanacetum cinerariifolium]
MWTQFTDYGFHFNKIPIYYDLKSTIAISCNPIQHLRTKHIVVRYHFIKEHVEKGTIELYFVKTEYQLADLFTKYLLVDRFNYLVYRLGMRSLSPHELEGELFGEIENSEWFYGYYGNTKDRPTVVSYGVIRRLRIARDAAKDLEPLAEGGDEQGGENGDDYEGGNRGGDRNGNRNREVNENGNGGGNDNGNENGNGNGNGGGNGYENHIVNFGGSMPVARECTYQDFLKCQPLNFKGVEGVVGLTRWFEKMEMVFHISNCPQKNQVKYATCTLLDSALTWWNTHKKIIRIDAAYAMTWIELMKLMIERKRDELKLILEKLQNSSKSLNTLLESQVSDKDKTGLGYKAASPAVEGFVNSSEILEKQENKSDKGYHAVPPPFTGNYMPPKHDLRLIDEHFERVSVDVISNIAPSDVKTIESKHKTVDVNHKGVFNTEEPKPFIKNNFSPPIIDDWHSDDESEVEISPKVEVKIVKPSIKKIKFVKTARETVKNEESPKQHKHH